MLCQMDLPPLGIVGATLKAVPPAAPKPISLPERIETNFYSAKVDPATGTLVSLKTKSGREMLGGPANEIVAEAHSCGDGPKWASEHVDIRPKRKRLAGSSEFKSTVHVTEGPVAITVNAQSDFYGGGKITRITRFLKSHPRIEFETELNDIPNLTVVVAEFPLAATPTESLRGIPFGFSRDTGEVRNIVPAIRWTDYSIPGQGGLALLDRGATPGRELNKNTPVIYLLNALDTYHGFDCAWLSGKGRQRFEYALVAHDEDCTAARIPQMAWEYNSPASVATNCQAVQSQSFVQTSDNLIVEAMRREGADISLISFGWQVNQCLMAAEELAKEGISAEVIDLRSLMPLDYHRVLDSVT